jgi:hypothetical protein
VAELQAGYRLLAAAGTTPPQVAIVVTYFVPTEFSQNVTEVRREAANAVVRLERLFDAAAVLGRVVTRPGFSTTPTLAESLVLAAERVLSGALLIDWDPGCVERALGRVVTKTKPAANGRIKDAIHLEHALELGRSVRAAGFPCRVGFISSNKADFGADKNDPRLDLDLLANDFAPAGLEYFARLEAAVGALGI